MMGERGSLQTKRPRVAYLLSHPIQYQAPLLRHLANQDEWDLEVLYLSDFSMRSYADQGFDAAVEWDIPLTEGYHHQFLSSVPSVRFAKPWIRGWRKRLQAGAYDALWVHGWSQLSVLQAVVAAFREQLPVLLRGESVPAERSGLRRAFLERLFSKAAACLPIGSLNRDFYQQHGVSADKLFDVPYSVDNQFFSEQSQLSNEEEQNLRQRLEIPSNSRVVLFASKLIERKRPEDLLNAFAQLSRSQKGGSVTLVMAGDGPLRSELEHKSRLMGLQNVRWVGFQNQTQLPMLYALCDVFCLPSEFETWGLVVNEAMAAGKPVIASDGVSAAKDLILPERTGWVFPKGDISALTQCLTRALEQPEATAHLGSQAQQHIQKFGFEADSHGLSAAISALGLSSGRSSKVPSEGQDSGNPSASPLVGQTNFEELG